MPTISGPAMDSTTGSQPPNDSEDGMTGDDAAWIITNAFIIFTMQTGFGLLESACVSRKNEVNIMMKNIIDVVLGSFTYWMFGYGLTFGKGPGSSPFCGFGYFFLDNYDEKLLGTSFQLSFATTATTIVSGAMAERCNFSAYCLFSLLNTIVYCIPAGWLWGDHGFLRKLGTVDIAGSGGVHLVGGVSAFVSAAMLGPHAGRYDKGTAAPPMGSPINAILGLFVLWWGWLSFNCGSTFGVTQHRWKYAARAATSTLTASFGGGLMAMVFSVVTKRGIYDVSLLINGILSALVGVTAGCSLYHPWEGLVVGIVGAFATCLCMPLVDYLQVNDPVGAVAVHAVGGFWGMMAVGLFPDKDYFQKITNGYSGVFKGGGFYLLGVQMLAIVALSSWAAISTFIILYCINKVIPIRMTEEEERLGADVLEHGIYLEEAKEPSSPEFSTLIIHNIPAKVKDDVTVISAKSAKDKKKPPRSKGRVKRQRLVPIYSAKYPPMAW